MTSIHPGINLKRTTGYQYLALADHGASGLIAHFRTNGVAVILIAMDQLGQLRVNLDPESDA